MAGGLFLSFSHLLYLYFVYASDEVSVDAISIKIQCANQFEFDYFRGYFGIKWIFRSKVVSLNLLNRLLM